MLDYCHAQRLQIANLRYVITRYVITPLSPEA
jgi:hypothetical protein